MRTWLALAVVFITIAASIFAPARAFDAIVPLTEPVDSLGNSGDVQVIDSTHYAQYLSRGSDGGTLRFFGADGRVTNEWDWQSRLFAPRWIGTRGGTVSLMSEDYEAVYAFAPDGTLLRRTNVGGVFVDYRGAAADVDNHGRTWLLLDRGERGAVFFGLGVAGAIGGELDVGTVARLWPSYPEALAAVLDASSEAMYYIEQSSIGSTLFTRLMRISVTGFPSALWTSTEASARVHGLLSVPGNGVVLVEGETDLRISRIDAQGNLLWRRILSGMGQLQRIAVHPDGTMALVASAPPPEMLAPPPQRYLYRLSGDGVQQWRVAVEVPTSCSDLNEIGCSLHIRLDGRVWFQDLPGSREPSRIQLFGTDGRVIRTLGEPEFSFTQASARFIDDDTILASDNGGSLRINADGSAVRVHDSLELHRSARLLRGAAIAPSGESYVNLGLGNGVDERFVGLNAQLERRWSRDFAIADAASKEKLRIRASTAGPIYAQLPDVGFVALDRLTGATRSIAPSLVFEYRPVSVVDITGSLVVAGIYTIPGTVRPGTFAIDSLTGAAKNIRLYANGEVPIAVGPGGEVVTTSNSGLSMYGHDGQLRYVRPTDPTDQPTSFAAQIGPVGELVRRLTMQGALSVRLYDRAGNVLHDYPALPEGPFGADPPGAWTAFDGGGGAYVLDTKESERGTRDVSIVHLPSNAQPARVVAQFTEPRTFLSEAWVRGGGSTYVGTSLLRHGDKLVTVSVRPAEVLVRTISADTGQRLRTSAYAATVECPQRYCPWSLDDSGSLRGALVVRDVPGGVPRAVAVRADSVLTPAPSIRVDQPGIRGIWYNPAYSGQGFTLDYAANTRTLFAAWFVHARDAENHPRAQRWFTLSGTIAPEARVAALRIYANRGGNFDAGPVTQAVDVGAAQLSFDDCNVGTLSWTFNPPGQAAAYNWLQAGEMRIARLGPRPADCADGSGASASYDARLTGSWYVPEISGQGINLYAVDGATPFIYGAWFTYDLASMPLGSERASQRWLTFQGSFDSAANGVAEGVIYETLGGRFALAATSNTRRVGTMRLVSLACDRARFEWRFDDNDGVGNLRGISGARVYTRLGPCPD